MKHTWVTGLSVFGVLGAGSAAVLANTTVFNSTTKSASAFTMSATSPTTPGSPLETPALDSTTASTTSSSTAINSTGINSTAPVAQTYAVGSSGTVQLTNANGVITIASAIASPGWTVHSSSAPGGWVVVEFLSANQRVAFYAFLVDGAVQVSVDTSAPDQPFVPKNRQEVSARGTESTQPTQPTEPSKPAAVQVTQPVTELTLPSAHPSDDRSGVDSDD